MTAPDDRACAASEWRPLLVLSDLHRTVLVVGVLIAEHADWSTGANARPSLAKIAARMGVARSTVKRAADLLCAAGWLDVTGRHGRQRVFRLTVPDVASLGRNTACHDVASLGRNTPSVASDGDVASLGRNTMLRPLGATNLIITERSEDDDEDGRAAAAGAAPPAADVDPGTVARAVDGIVATLTGAGGPTYYAGAEVDRQHLAPRVRELLSAGWTPGHLVAHAVTVGRPSRSPTGLLASHLAKLAGRDPEAEGPAPLRWRLAAAGVRDVGDLSGLLETLDGFDLLDTVPGADLDAPLFTEAGERSTARGVTECLAELARRERAGEDPLGTPVGVCP